MGRNKAVSAAIIKKLRALPGRVHAAGLEAAIFFLPANSYQDSGRAAFNWQTESGRNSARVYLEDRGRPPVGNRGDRRTGTGKSLDVVSKFRVKEAMQLLRSIREGSVSTSNISNPIPKVNEFYEENAKLEEAIDSAKSEIESAMKAEVDHWHKENGR